MAFLFCFLSEFFTLCATYWLHLLNVSLILIFLLLLIQPKWFTFSMLFVIALGRFISACNIITFVIIRSAHGRIHYIIQHVFMHSRCHFSVWVWDLLYIFTMYFFLWCKLFDSDLYIRARGVALTSTVKPAESLHIIIIAIKTKTVWQVEFVKKDWYLPKLRV